MLSACGLPHDSVTWLQAEQFNKHLQVEQAKAAQDKAAWDKREAELLQELSESMDSAQRLKLAQATHDQDFNQFQVRCKDARQQAQWKCCMPLWQRLVMTSRVAVMLYSPTDGLQLNTYMALLNLYVNMWCLHQQRIDGRSSCMLGKQRLGLLVSQR